MGMLQIPLHSIGVRMECRIHVKYLTWTIDDELGVSSSLLWARCSPRFAEEGRCSARYGWPSFLVPEASPKTFIPAPHPRPPSPQMPHDLPKMKVFPFGDSQFSPSRLKSALLIRLHCTPSPSHYDLCLHAPRFVPPGFAHTALFPENIWLVSCSSF